MMNNPLILDEIHLIFKRRRAEGQRGRLPKLTEQYVLSLLEQYSGITINRLAAKSLSCIEIAILILAACDHRQKECAYYLVLHYDTLSKYQKNLRQKLASHTVAGCLKTVIKLQYFSI